MRRKAYVLLVLLLGLSVLFYVKYVRVQEPTALAEAEDTVLQVSMPARIKIEDLDQYITLPLSNRSKWRSYPEPRSFPSHSLEYDRMGHSPSIAEDTTEGQFTISILTYDRTEVLFMLLTHLSGLSQLAQVIIVWNHPVGPSPDLQWPTVDYPYRVLKARNNSLNNRFIPLSIINTDGVFILDDDTFFDHASLLLAFRVWQAHRDRVVGFRGRGASWDSGTKKWKYVTHPNIVSIVLTGAAFIHKRYMDSYTYEMPPVIREHVDQTMNCEDIATQFLVSFISQTPPIQIGYNKWYGCPGCSEKPGLWQDPAHFRERDFCINYFADVFESMPLLKSEYRKADFMVIEETAVDGKILLGVCVCCVLLIGLAVLGWRIRFWTSSTKEYRA